VKMFYADKTRIIWVTVMKNYDNMLSRLHLIPERHGQTDRVAISISHVSVKNPLLDFGPLKFKIAYIRHRENREIAIRQRTSTSVISVKSTFFLLLVTSASDLPLRTHKFCFVLFTSSWSSILVMINKGSLTRGGVCGKQHGGQS